MDRKAIIAIGLSLLVLIFYPYYLKMFHPKKEASQTEKITEEQMSGREDLAKKAGPGLKTVGMPEPVVPEAEEEEFFIQTDLCNIVLSSYGGTIKRLGLKKYKNNEKKEEDLVSDKAGILRPLAFTRVGSSGDLSNAVFKGRIEDKKVIFETVTSDNLSIRKVFYFKEDEYLFTVKTVFKNLNDEELYVDGYNIAYGTIFPVNKKTGVAELGIAVMSETDTIIREKVKKIKEDKTLRGPFKWSGLQNQYYALIAKPDTKIEDIVSHPILNERKKVWGFSSEIEMGSFSLAGGGVHEEDFVFYMGPKEYSIMKKAPFQFGKILYFGWFGFISEWILIALNFFYGIFRNYGVAIIIITVIIKIILYPLSAKSLKSMKQMQTIQPLINEIRANNKDNPKKMQKEMMMVYKEYKVNPMSGCLPMVAQLPIFIALFTTLRNAIELKGSKFLWIHDLSAPDTIFSIGPVPVNLLPLIMGVTMVWQQKLTPMSDPSQAKMMMIMPIVFTFLFYNFPSGLVLYWLVNNILSIWQQYKIQKA